MGYFKKIIKRSNFPYISSNISGIKGVKPYLLKNIHGTKILFLGLCSKDIDFKIEKSIRDKIHVKDYYSAISDVLEHAPAHDICVLLDNCTLDENILIAKKTKGIDIILFPQLDAVEYVKVGLTTIVAIGGGLSGRSVIDVEHEAARTVFMAGDFPKEAKSKKIIEKYLKIKNSRSNNLIVEIKEPERFQEITANILRELTRSEIAVINKGFFRANISGKELRKREFKRIFVFKNRAGNLKIPGNIVKKMFLESISPAKKERSKIPAGTQIRHKLE